MADDSDNVVDLGAEREKRELAKGPPPGMRKCFMCDGYKVFGMVGKSGYAEEECTACDENGNVPDNREQTP